MDRILKGVTQVGCYIDDAIIGGSSIDDCRLKLEEVLTRLRDHIVTLRMEKCKLFCSEVRYQGHGISAERIRPLGLKLTLVRNFTHRAKRWEDIVPVSAKLRQQALAICKQVASELHRLEGSDFSERVSASEWVSPLVIIRKKDKDIRLHVDLREPNKVIVMHAFHCPM
nr:uncharacterized protein LOC119179121 [Rhipicephalus microplus]